MNAGLWRLEDVERLVQLVREGTPVSVISMALGRDIGEVEAKIIDLGLHHKSEAARPATGQRDGEPES